VGHHRRAPVQSTYCVMSNALLSMRLLLLCMHQGTTIVVVMTLCCIFQTVYNANFADHARAHSVCRKYVCQTKPTFLSVIVKTPGASSLRCCDAREDDQSSSLSCGAPRHATPCGCEGSTFDGAIGTLQDTPRSDL